MYTISNQPLYQHHQNEYQHQQYSGSLYNDQSNVQQQAVTTATHNQFETAFVPQNLTAKTNKVDTKPRAKHPSTYKKTKSNKPTTEPVDTSHFSVEERLVAAVWVHERKRTKTKMSQITADFRARFGRQPPAKNTLLQWERKCFSTGSVHDAPRPGRPINRKFHLPQVEASMKSAPALSLRRRAVALRVPRTTLHTIIHKDLSHTLPNKHENKIKNEKQQTKKQVGSKTKGKAKRSSGKTEDGAPFVAYCAHPHHSRPAPHT